MNAIPSRTYMPALTGLRFVAAIMVVLFHYERANDAWPVFFQKLLEELYIGVNLFFVLSGFLITHRYGFPEPGQATFSFRTYLRNRFARIYPLFFILATGTFLVRWFLDAAHRPDEWINCWLSLTLLKGFSQTYFLHGIPQSWSLSVEELFYLLAPVIFFLVRKQVAWLVTLPLVLAGLGLCLVRLFSLFPCHGFFEDKAFMFTYTFFGRSTEFLAGVGLAFYYRKYGGRPLVSSFRYTGAGLVGIVLCLIFLAMNKGDLAFGYLHPMGLAVHNLVLPLVGFVPLMWGLLTEKNRLSDNLSSSTAGWLGKSSYALYLIHLGVVQSLLSRISENSLFMIPAMIFLSVLAWRYVEEPLNRLIRQ